MFLPSLCLGSAQFGQNYGITNSNGKVPCEEIEKILKAAYVEKVSFIDTAQDYGDAENVIGNAFELENKFKIINKFSTASPKSWNSEIVQRWEKRFFESLESMQVSKFDCFLIHNIKDIQGVDSKILINWLLSLKERSLVKRIGVSIFDPFDLKVIPMEIFDLFQLPLSIYDQRFLKNGAIDFLFSQKKSIHVRSIFLQGLILQNPDQWPDFISKNFRNHHFKSKEILSKNKLNLLKAALLFVQKIEKIEAVLFGVTNLIEFNQILSTWKCLKNKNNLMEIDYDFSWEIINDIDPRRWVRD